MNLEDAIYSQLVGDATIGAAVGTRVFPDVIPEDAALPAIAYQRISTPRLYSMSGPSGLAWPRFQFTMKATLYATAQALANALRASLSDYKGVMGGGAGVRVDAIFIENETEDWDESPRTYWRQMDAIIWHHEN